MNRQSYLSELNHHLKSNSIEDAEDIIAEYDEHFSRKIADGYAEEEIAANLGDPKEIAAQFAIVERKTDKKSGNKFLTYVGLVFVDVFTVPFFIVMYAWLVVLGAIAVASALCGIGLVIRPLLPSDIFFLPHMPYTGGALFGVVLMALGVLTAAATIYSNALTVQMRRSYMRWHKNRTHDGIYPPYAINPLLEESLHRKLRTIGMIAMITFGAAFIIGYIVLSLNAGSIEFWHVWQWFQ